MATPTEPNTSVGYDFLTARRPSHPQLTTKSKG